MKLTTREDIEAPIAFVYAQLTDFDGWQRAALRRGAEVSRTDSLPAPAPGMTWVAAFAWRGKPRSLMLKLDQLQPQDRIAFSGTGANVDGTLALDLVQMSPRRTRVSVALEVRPRTLIARLFLQSMALAKTKVQGRFKARVAQIGAEIEARHGGGSAGRGR